MMDKELLMEKILGALGGSDEPSEESGEGKKCPHCGADLS